MVGGTVIEVSDVPGRPEVLFIDCADMPGKWAKKPDTCAIMVERNAASEKIQVGDSIWWQGRVAMWTPRDSRGKYKQDDAKGGVHYDIQIPRVGYSGIQHPSRVPAGGERDE